MRCCLKLESKISYSSASFVNNEKHQLSGNFFYRFTRKSGFCHGFLYKGAGCFAIKILPKMFPLSSRLRFWWLWYDTECCATENACEQLRVHTKYHKHTWKYSKMQFKHHLPRPIIMSYYCTLFIFIIYYFVICIYLHFMSVKSEVRWIGVR